MPLSAKARIEVYIPDSPNPAYRDLLEQFEEEFTYAFGGCSVLRSLDGCYLSRTGALIRDRVSVLYTDSTFSATGNMKIMESYAEKLLAAANAALDEEKVLVVVWQVHHAE